MKFAIPDWARPAAALAKTVATAMVGAVVAGVRFLFRRWLAIGMLGAGAAFFMVLGYFTIGHLVGRSGTAERVRLYAKAVVDNSLDALDRAVRGQAAVRAQANDWKPMASELQDLEINMIALVSRPTRSGGMTQLDGGRLLVVTAHGDFVTLDTATSNHAPARIASPINVATYQADPLWNVPGNDHNYFRVNDILAIRNGANGYTLFATHYWFTKDCIEWRLSRTDIVVENGAVRQTDAWKKIFTATPCFQTMTEFSAAYQPFSGNLSGGRMIDYDADHLLMTIGDEQVFEARGVDVAQDPTVTMGKIVLVDKVTGKTSIFAMGERNAQGLMRDAQGRIWETEHGPHGGDELNLVRQGDNLGWPVVTYGVNYDSRPWPNTTVEGRHDKFRRPVFAWMPSIGVSNVIAAPGDAFPNWRGDLLVGSLVANSLFRVRIEGDDAIYAEQMKFSGHAMRDLDVLADGRIAILDNRMSMIFIRNADGYGKSRAYDPEQATLPRIAGNGLSKVRVAQVLHGAELFGRRCAECHSLVGAAGAGPQLRDVAGRHVGGEPNFSYSEALAGAGGSWSEGALSKYISAPESLGPTVAMPNLGLGRDEAAEIAAYLVELRKQDRKTNGRHPPHMAENGGGGAAN